MRNDAGVKCQAISKPPNSAVALSQSKSQDLARRILEAFRIEPLTWLNDFATRDHQFVSISSLGSTDAKAGTGIADGAAGQSSFLTTQEIGFVSPNVSRRFTLITCGFYGFRSRTPGPPPFSSMNWTPPPFVRPRQFGFVSPNGIRNLLAARRDGRWLILDNRHLMLDPDSVSHFRQCLRWTIKA